MRSVPEIKSVTCSFCGVASAKVAEGPGVSICQDCVVWSAPLAGDFVGEYCSFCRQVIGGESRFVEGGEIRVARVSRVATLCDEYLETARAQMAS